MNLNATCEAKTVKSRFDHGIPGWQGKSLLRKIELLSVWRKRIRYRRDLRRLLQTGRHLVVDTGLGVDEAMHEISKPFYIE